MAIAKVHYSMLLRLKMCVFANRSSSNLHHGSTRASLCTPFYSITFSTTTKVTIYVAHLMASVWVLSKCTPSKAASYAFSCLECYPMCLKQLKMKCSDTPWLSKACTFKLIAGMPALTIEFFVFSIMAGLIIEMLFMLFFVYNIV